MNNLCIIIAITYNAYYLRKIPLGLKEALLNVNYNKNNILNLDHVVVNGVNHFKVKTLNPILQ